MKRAAIGSGLNPHDGKTDLPVAEKFVFARAGPLSVVRGSVLGEGHIVFMIGMAGVGDGEIGAGGRNRLRCNHSLTVVAPFRSCTLPSVTPATVACVLV